MPVSTPPPPPTTADTPPEYHSSSPTHVASTSGTPTASPISSSGHMWMRHARATREDEVPPARATNNPVPRGVGDARRSLMSHILEWGIPGILADDFLRSRVSPIPDRFQSVTHYLDSLKWPLLEEIRASMKASITSIGVDVPHVSLADVSELPPSDVLAADHLRILEATALAAPADSAAAPIPPFKPNDLIIVCFNKAGGCTAEQVVCAAPHARGAIAVVVRSVDEDFVDALSEDDIPRSSRLRFVVHQTSAVLLTQRGARNRKEAWQVGKLASLSTFLRIWQALHTENAESLPMLNTILARKHVDAEDKLETDDSSRVTTLLKAYCASRNLNESQTRAVTYGVGALQSGSPLGVPMIQGPPGTGKTSTLVTLLSVASCLGMKCLVVAATNVAVAGAATRFLQMITSSHERQFGDFHSDRFPRRRKVLTEGDVVLVGDDDKLRVQGSILEAIYLPHRVKAIRRRLLSQSRNQLSSRESIEVACMRNASVVFSTVSTAGSVLVQHASPFSCVIVDEAAQLAEAETSILTCSLAIDKAVLVGDPQQLPATVVSEVARKCGYGRSLMERLRNIGFPCFLLDTQYRMHPSISAFPSANFYGGRLVNGENVKSTSYQAYESLSYGSYAFIDVGDGEEQDGGGDAAAAGRETSKKNTVEAFVVLGILNDLQEKVAHVRPPTMPRISVGVITPYSSQRELLKKLLLQKNMAALHVDVNSVDGYQGQERDVVILSTVRANKTGSLGFVKDPQRLNVAMTRARYCFWIVGHRKTLVKTQNVWNHVLRDLQGRRLLRNAAADPNLLMRIVKAKEATDRFQTLLHPGSVLFSNKPWRVIFSNDFVDSLMKLRSTDERMKVLQKILFLSFGRGFSGRTRVMLPPIAGLMIDIDGLVQVIRVANRHLVWSVDVQRYAPVKQIIKIWNLLESWSDLLNYTKRIAAALRVYSSKYIDRCKQRSANSDRNLTLPVAWEDDERFVWFKSHDQSKNAQCGDEDVDDAEKSKVNESLLVMKFYALTSGAVHHLLTAEDGSEVDLPFELNIEERAIIQHTSSCFVLGRSGTGKTSAILIKLLQREQLHLLSRHGPRYSPPATITSMSESSERGRSLKQMAVTFSPLLCSAMNKEIHGIRRCMIDTSAKEDRGVSPNVKDEMLILDTEDEMLALDFLPNTLVGVPNACYPMVITFRKLLAMLENSVPCPLQLNGRISSCMQSRREVDYQSFLSIYWPRLNEAHRKGLDASTTFTEIISVIKGSIQAVKSHSGYLSREDYLSYRSSSSKVAQSQLDIRKRENVYDLFLLYQGRKKDRGEHDLADRVRHLYKQLASGEYRGDKMDFIYVDEVQDFTQAQLLLFSFLSSDARNGFVFAGDTAQVIASGVSFRFEDARSMFYTEFGSAEAQKRSSSSQEESMAIAVPRFFQLKHNYRSHMGIVRVANSIVELIHRFFPNSIDKLESETSLVSGEKPVLLEARKEEIVSMVFGGNAHNEPERQGLCRFGARQVVLVRDEEQKRRIVDESGLNGLVLTINGCKGLEFEDVLIYNFFSESPLENQWRVLYEHIQPNRTGRTVEAHPTFDNNRHHPLRNELMRLYVAVTRTRQRLWFYEENEFGRPMLDYWMQRALIVRKSADASLISKMARSSSQEEWRSTGMKLLKQKQFDVAMISFGRAGDKHNSTLSKAAKLKEEGETLLLKNKRLAKDHLREAARIFLDLGRAEHAARCLIRMDAFEDAGNIYLERFNPPRYENAGECFEEAKIWNVAATAFYNGRFIRRCLDVCLQGDDSDMALSFIFRWDKEFVATGCEPSSIQLPPRVRDDYLHKCAENYHRRGKFQRMMSALDALSDANLKRQCLKKNGYIDELICFEETEKNYESAAALAGAKRDVFRMVALLEKRKHPKDFIETVLFRIRADLLLADVSRQLISTANDSRLQPIDSQSQAEIERNYTCFKLRNDLVTCRSMLRRSLTAAAHHPRRAAAVKCTVDLLYRTHNIWIDWRGVAWRYTNSLHDLDKEKIDGLCRRVHNEISFWLRSSRKNDLASTKRMPPRHDFEVLAPRYWDEQPRIFDNHICSLLARAMSLQQHEWKLANTDEALDIFGRRIKLLLNVCERTRSLLLPHSSDDLQRFIVELCRAILRLLWPPSRPSPKMMSRILLLRKDRCVTEFLDHVAGMLVSDPDKKQHITFREVGQLLIIVPYVSERKLKEICSDSNSKAGNNLSEWEKEVCRYHRSLTESEPAAAGPCAECTILENLRKILQSGWDEWSCSSDFNQIDIGPFHAFLTLLERVSFMACAFLTRLHGLYLPLSMAMDVLCGHSYNWVVQKIIDGKHEACEKTEIIAVRELMADIARTILQLLSDLSDTTHSGYVQRGQEKSQVREFVLRLVVLMLMIHANELAYDEMPVAKVVMDVHVCATVERYLPVDIKAQLCSEALDRDVVRCRLQFAEALGRMEDALSMTRRCVADSKYCRACCCSRAVDGNVVNETVMKIDLRVDAKNRLIRPDARQLLSAFSTIPKAAVDLRQDLLQDLRT